jgi:hypothetical protein
VCWDSIHTGLSGFLFWIVLFNELYTIWSYTYAFFLSTYNKNLTFFAMHSGPLPVFLSQSISILLCLMILLHCNLFFLTFYSCIIFIQPFFHILLLMQLESVHRCWGYWNLHPSSNKLFWEPAKWWFWPFAEQVFGFI